jgi:hypothetical protein
MPSGRTSWRGIVDIEAALAHQARRHARLLAHLAPGGLVGQLAGIDVAAGRQPHAQLAVKEQQHALAGDDKDGHGEVALRRFGRGLGHRGSLLLGAVVKLYSSAWRVATKEGLASPVTVQVSVLPLTPGCQRIY